jgi:hypothetical protein
VLESERFQKEAVNLSQSNLILDDALSTKYMDLLKRAQDIQSKYLAPTHAALYRTRCEYVMALCQHGHWQEAFLQSMEVIAQQKRYLPSPTKHPLHGIHLYIHARIASWLDRLPLAIQTLEKALRALSTGGLPLRRLVDRAARESQELQFEMRRRAAIY